MITRNLALAAGLGLAAEAFLLPSSMSLPGLSAEGEQPANDGDFHILRIPEESSQLKYAERLESLNAIVASDVPIVTDGFGVQSARVALACPGCSTEGGRANDDGLTDELVNDEPRLILNFEVMPKDNVLALNGRTLDPSLVLDGPLEADLLYSDSTGPSRASGALDFISVSGTTTAEDGSGAEVTDLLFQITSYNGQDVAVGAVNVHLWSEFDTLRLHHVTTSPGPAIQHLTHDVLRPDNDEPKSEHATDECGSKTGAGAMMCRLRTAVKDKIVAWNLMQPSEDEPHLRKPCSGRLGMGNHPRPPFIKGGPAKFMPHHSFDHPERHHGHHEHHGRPHFRHGGFVHSFASALRAFVLGFMVPVIIGVAAGMTASLVGMVFGTFIAWAWIKLVRGGKRGNASQTQLEREALVASDDDVIVGEKEGLLDHAPDFEAVDAPPTYVEKE